MPYVIRQQILEKWARQHLVLRRDGDLVECDFLYTGSTCSNGGLEILARIHVSLRAEGEDYRITGAEITTRSGDVGLELSCQYLVEGDEFLSRHLEECRIVGHSLSEFVVRDVDCVPAGCFCQPANVMHKAQMALQTIRYALTHEEELARTG